MLHIHPIVYIISVLAVYLLLISAYYLLVFRRAKRAEQMSKELILLLGLAMIFVLVVFLNIPDIYYIIKDTIGITV